MAELVRFGHCDEIEKMVKVAETLEKSKTGTASGLQTGVVMAEVRYQTCLASFYSTIIFKSVTFKKISHFSIIVFMNFGVVTQ